MTGAEQRFEELRADRVLWGLSTEELAELEEVARELGVGPHGDDHDYDYGSLEFAAAAVTAAHYAHAGPAPAALVGRLRTDAMRWFSIAAPSMTLRLSGDPSPSPGSSSDALSSGVPSSGVPSPRVPSSGAPSSGWRTSSGFAWSMAAAALLASVVLAWDRFKPQPSPAELRSALLASRASTPQTVLQIDWKPGPSPLRGDPAGDVIWDHATQHGFMRFRGLPQNDPNKRQYQLWIFDKRRSADQPVDGGVFDIPSGVGPDGASEIVVPIHAKIRVHEAFGFAVTIEEPGGVVVSDREHIVTTAGL